MAKAKTNKAPDEIMSVVLYGNFKQGKHLSKFLGKVEVIGDCQTLQPFLCYNGLGGISKLHNINAGKCIKLQHQHIDTGAGQLACRQTGRQTAANHDYGL